ncbi:MAG: S-layer homology domain-containing protein [Eubacteriales bacterium]|jgi:hypothetical protein|nr:cadherin-like domain-containing protein [Clostridiales bacterium]
MAYHFNRHKKLLAFLLVAALTLATGSILAPDAFAASDAQGYQVSPALNILANKLELVKTAVAGSDIEFAPEDFEEALGVKKLDAITVVTLPSSEYGTLMLGSTTVMKNQTISRKNLSLLRFVPSDSAVALADGSYAASTDFVFRAAGKAQPYEVLCTLYVLSELNLAPTVTTAVNGKQKLTALRNVDLYGRLMATDPEGDALRYVITKYPSKGTLELTNESYGSYCYRPKVNWTGSDSFTYAVYDQYGNRSEEVKVTVKVEKPDTKVVYDDLNGHWAHYAALRMAEKGVMVGETVGGKTLFNPDKAVSRVEFLAMAMKATGKQPLSGVVNTGFADDANILPQYKGYVAAAAELGYITGVDTDTGRYFLPNYQITRAEAAVILSSMIGTKRPVLKTVFADESSIPAWANDAIAALAELGIMTGTVDGTISASSGLTRAQTACLLNAMMEQLK